MTWSDVLFESLYSSASRNGVYKAKEFHGRGTRIVNMGELFGYSFISNQEMKRVELDERELDLNSLEDGDLLFGRRSLVESGAGKCSLVVSPLEPITFESSIIRVRVNKEVVNPRFLYYYFLSPQGRGRIRSIVSGTNVKGIRGSDLKKISVANPSKVVQDGIVAALSAYDDLIDNNIRRMALLEDSARQLYREWFVRLRFPGHEHTPIVDGVPQGWERKTLGDLCREVRDMVLPEALEPDTPYIGLEHIPRRSISLNDWGTVEEVTSSKCRFKAGEIIFGKIRPYFHKVGVAFVDGVTSSDAIVVRPLDESLHSLVLMTMSSDEFVAVTSQQMKEGSKMPRADWKQMKAFSVQVPPPGLLKNFDDVIQPTVEQLRTLSFANQKLRQARDLLLPRLMNGELAV